MNRKLFCLALAASLAFTIGGTAQAQPASQTLRFGVEASYPPFESKTASGQLEGFDIDIGNAVCQRLQMKCVWVENSFDGLIAALQARKFDVINSAMNITAKRRQAIDFTPPIYIMPIQMIAKRGSGLQPTPASLKGKSVGVLQGSTQEDFVRKHWAKEGVQVVTYQNQDQIFADLAAGRLDGAVQEVQTAIDGFLAKPEGKDFDFAGPAVSDPATLGEGTGFGLRKGDTALKAKIVAALDGLKKDGTLSQLSQKYFKRDIIAK
ncbi:Lysine-arginine-ornithine-binding periplasmic protein precursor (TC 3.A.1.3.1) [Caballeronia glathei]|jgi:lysine/arginine/ornithine transport system substrate-binding protein|uniref:ABC transporter substrate-binding protein n=1 Tax=Caballeronia glathei TaxID=60547 RepID=A0A069PSF6_9BURK|nr:MULTISPECIES: ABC transporter substrate-binding protein [Burkholderiaceae]KDR43638.1 ABC transporter substrate-binding protein [Caballeronia glathei]TCK43711.1 amino acid ABC transporter substrate-binding protein (PAAT family) [Paraburkholderia sp. BL8N3]CDY75443.1 Lysine-arginine-ornithine-binding periplasmic protein precursor (TC 3.A.1.3.1) [Caballeronia glathei]